MPKFPNGRPLPWDQRMYQVVYFEHIPPAVRTEKVSKRFVHGWSAVVDAVCATLCTASHPQLPTPEAVMKVLDEMVKSGQADERDTKCFFKNGGRIEFALDALERSARTTFLEVEYLELFDGECEEYDCLPTHPLDECWDMVRHALLGPRGRVEEGPWPIPK
eukprot:3815087-Pleurochrysis_carterae.AAC.1